MGLQPELGSNIETALSSGTLTIVHSSRHKSNSLLTFWKGVEVSDAL